MRKYGEQEKKKHDLISPRVEAKQTAEIQLLKRGKTGILRLLFSRMGIVLMLLLLNIGILVTIFARFEELLPLFYGANTVFVVAMVIYLINSSMDATAKITWLIVIMLLPVFGSLLYLYTRTEVGHRAMKKRLQNIYAATKDRLQPSRGSAFLEEQNPGAGAMTRYVSNFTGVPVYGNSQVTYFPSGEKLFDCLLSELENAATSIYLEYFIIAEGKMWGSILEILARKAAQGVDVRVMYDGTCEFALLPKGYAHKLQELGIACRVFAPVTPFVSTHYNYRDHRKILTVDGRVAFTGGINLADEYINENSSFGYWKDTAVMIRGEAATGFEHIFLQAWNVKETEFVFSIPKVWEEEMPASQGFVMPYFDDPLDDEQIGKQVYLDILNRAKDYVCIMTPYLILDGELEAALKYAAKRGVEVSLLLPGIPDKKLPYALAKSHYAKLVEAGVKLYAYTPGFVHGKMMLSDDREAVVGTINLDYRSLYHHFECAAYLYAVPCIKDMVEDFHRCIGQSAMVTPRSIKNEKFFYKVAGALLKVIAPLL
ncbi:MAG: cardiolipin synthase [Oscillospiraceae bacterium]|nr:cardiolipin synthase [Oscillospiraceae bacterium]